MKQSIQLLSVVRQPQWIAAILSVGFHGVLFAVGPTFSSLNMAALGGDLSIKDNQRQVPLIELTPEEQARLPDFSGSAYSFQPGSDDSLFGMLPPQTGDSLPLNPGTASLPPPSTFNPPLGSSPFTLTPYSSSRRPPLVFTPRRTPLPSPSIQPNQLPGDGRTTLDPNPGLPEGMASTPTTGVPDQHRGPTAADLMPRVAVNGHGNSTPGQAASAPGSANPSGSGQSLPPGAAAVIAQREAMTYNQEGTSDQALKDNQAQWIEAVKAKSPAVDPEVNDLSDNLSLAIPYDGRICLSPNPTPAVVGIWTAADESQLDDENTLALTQVLLRSTGYPWFNQAAMDAIASLQPKDLEKLDHPLQPNTLYQVTVQVEFDPDTCIDRDSLLKEINSKVETPPTQPHTAPTGASPTPTPADPGASAPTSGQPQEATSPQR